MLFGHFPSLIVVILIYAAGYGIFWVGRGTLPLALFGPLRFPRLMGKIAFPSLIVQALAPIGRRVDDRNELARMRPSAY